EEPKSQAWASAASLEAREDRERRCRPTCVVGRGSVRPMPVVRPHIRFRRTRGAQQRQYKPGGGVPNRGQRGTLPANGRGRGKARALTRAATRTVVAICLLDSLASGEVAAV